VLYGWFNPETRTEPAIAREIEAGDRVREGTAS
jgi:hypothetical protein